MGRSQRRRGSHEAPARVQARRPAGGAGRVALRLLLPLTVLAGVLVLAAGGSSPAGAQAGESIVIRHSGKCLGIAGSSTANLAAAVQQTCDGRSGQSFAAVDAGGGYVTLRATHSNRCLDVESGSTANLARIIQHDCHGGNNQQFRLDAVDGTWSRLVARQSGRCVDVEAGSGADGAAIIQYDCHGGNNQQFRLDASATDPGRDGRWSPVIDTPLVPVAASALPNGKVLMWSAYSTTNFGGSRGYTQTSVFDPATSASTARQVSNTGHDMFCPGIANLADGRILVNGGSNASETSIYDPATDSWQDGADMNIPRGYQGTTMLSDGSVFTLGGSWSGGLGGKTAERWTEAGGWRVLSGLPADPFVGNDPAGIYRSDNHMWLFAWKDETVFHAGPSRNMHWIDPSGSGSYRSAGARGSDTFAINGNAVMYEPGRILALGGAQAYTDGQASANATVIDITGSSVSTRTVQSMAQPRVFHSSTVLPSGEIVVTGGQTFPRAFRDDDSVMVPEIWDPDTETFRQVAPMAVPRNYHSVGLLIPDGRVLVGGGGLCGGCAFNHPDVQLYTPPYLLNDDGSDAVRPRIISAPDSVDLNERFEVTTNSAVSEFALIRMASATHAVNNDQRRIPLTATPGSANLTYEVQMPAEGGVAPPGAYMLFAMDAQGAPSVAAIVTVTTDVAADREASIGGIVTQEDGTVREGVKVDLFERAADGSRATFLGSTRTGADGRFSFDVEPGCHVLTFIAPDGETFVDGRRWHQPSVCVDPGQVVTDADATLRDPPTGDEPSIGGTVRFTDGSPAGSVKVDLFRARADGGRGEFLGSTRTGADGAYRFTVEPGCHVLTFIAPDGTSFQGRRYHQPGACADPGETVTGVDAELTADGDQGSLGGRIARADGSGAEGAKVDLFVRQANGSRGAFLGSTRAGADGRYSFAVSPGCYVLTFIAPDGESYGGGRYFQPWRCLAAGQDVTDADATLDP